MNHEIMFKLLEMNNSNITYVLIIGFTAIILVLFNGLDKIAKNQINGLNNIANNQQQSEYEACMEDLEYQNIQHIQKVGICIRD